MDLLGRSRPSVSRETRLLFLTVLISLVALWVLARVRFADRALASNPVAPVLTQLAAAPVFDQLSTAVAQINKQTAPLLIEVGVRTSAGRPAGTVSALRFPGGIAVSLLGPSMVIDAAGETPEASLVARDPATGLTIFTAPAGETTAEISPQLSMWSPRRPNDPRFLIAADATFEGVASRPVFVGSLGSTPSPLWGDTIWSLPPDAVFDPGAFVFTTDGAFCGVIVRERGVLALVPANVLSETVERLRREGRREYGRLGVRTQGVPPGAVLPGGHAGGVVVTEVDPQGPAAGRVTAGDVILAVRDAPTASYEHWLASTARVGVGETVSLSVVRDDTIETITLTAAGPQSDAATPPTLGLTMRAVPRHGAEVLRVEPGSAAARAGIETGDVIISLAGRPSPAPAEVRQLFAAAASDRPLIVTLARGAAHRVLVLEKR
jgi:hypothetical protein